MRAAQTAYSTHRMLQLHTREILGAKGAKGMPDASTQREVLLRKIDEGELMLREIPQFQGRPSDLYVACEFETDGQGNFTRVAKIYRDSEVTKVVVGGVQMLKLGLAGKNSTREVIGFSRRGVSDQLEPAPNAILGQDTVELRVRDGAEPDPEKWNVIEFGEPELLKETSLARFALLNAYLERSRKDMAMKRANLALVAEPIIAGLNIAPAWPVWVPLGEAARIGYNLATFRLISNVPSQRQMRELFAVMAARDRDPAIRTRPEAFLSKRDIDELRREGVKLSHAEIQQYLARMSDEDVLAMLRLARMGMFDARITTFLNLLTSIFKTSGISDDPGPIREIFNNAYFSVNGDLNISTMFLAAIGRKDLTPLSGVSLESLAHGEGPPEAWLQYLSVSLDIRALANTIVRLTKRTHAKKELEKPFPYAPRMDEVAAYEIRIFGYPLLMYYKRGLLKLDREAYGRDYAYGLLGVKVVEFFPERENMEAEIRAGRMFPLGLVKVPTAEGWKESDRWCTRTAFLQANIEAKQLW
jgi:hypothetical protein